MSARILTGDVRAMLATLPDQSVQTVITSPPYFGLRDYGTAQWEGGDAECDHRLVLGGNGAHSTKQVSSNGTQTYQYRDTCGKCGAERIDAQIGMEPTPAEYVAALVAVFREVRRVLRDDGTVWLNLGDSYNSDTHRTGGSPRAVTGNTRRFDDGSRNGFISGLKPKDLIGIPWRVAFALQADGWYLRSDIIWAKPNPMPESVTDRPTKAHEFVFLLTKSARYYYDAAAIAEPVKPESAERYGYAFSGNKGNLDCKWQGGPEGILDVPTTRNKRSVWQIATQPYPEAHFATFPESLAEPCVLAGSREGDTVLDPFCGSGTTGVVALRHGRSFVGIDLNPEYAELARRRITNDAPLFNRVEVTA